MTMPAGLNVRVLDISLSGVLLHSELPVPIGTRGHLRLNLGGLPLKADVEVRHIKAELDASGYRVGIMFVSLSPDSARLHEVVTRWIDRA